MNRSGGAHACLPPAVPVTLFGYFRRIDAAGSSRRKFSGTDRIPAGYCSLLNERSTSGDEITPRFLCALPVQRFSFRRLAVRHETAFLGAATIR